MEWFELRDYVLREANLAGENLDWEPTHLIGIFKSFCGRWDNHEEIARYAFEIARGVWHGTLVGPQNFAKASDEWFAAEIDRLLRK